MAADALITDYSSAAFDYLMLERPFCFFVKDLEKFERSRGVYPEILEDFASFVARDEVEAISVLTKGYDASSVKNVDRYIEGPAGFASEALAAFICSVRDEIREEAHQKPFLHLVHSNDSRDDDPEDAIANG